MTDKTLGEQRRDMVLGVLDARYPDRLDRAAIRRSILRTACDDGPLDSAIHMLKQQCDIARTDEGYQLVTAPEWYNQKLVADANAAGDKVSPMDEKPVVKLAAPVGRCVPDPLKTAPAWVIPKGDGVERCPRCGQLPTECACKPFDDEWPTACSSETCDGAATPGADPALCGACDGGPVALDPVTVRRELAELQERLTADPAAVNDIDLKLEVLEYLGRILDDGIEAVLVSIAGDLRG